MASISSQLQNILLQIAQNENFKSPAIAMEESPNHGFIANVNKITLKDSNPNGEKPINLFTKIRPEEILPGWDFLYKCEGVFYNTIVPLFREIASETGLSLPLMPKCYFANENIIVLEDLIENGYKLWMPLYKSMDSAHTKAVLRAYGKFHAFSFALKHKHPEKFNGNGEKYEWFITNHDRLVDNGYYKSLTEKLAECFDQDTEFHYIEAVAKYLVEGQTTYLNRLLDHSENDVYIHGDNWSHNYMFRYGDNNKPKDVCILDFQIYRKATPVVDLSYFLTTSACCQQVFDGIWDYLKIYHESLIKNLKLLNCPDNLYTWEALQSDWNSYSLKGFQMATIILKMMIADKEELESRKDIELPMQFDFVSKNEELYQERMRIVIKYFYDAGILTS